MTEPINLQVNVLQIQDAARQASALKDVESHQSMGQEMNRTKESVAKQETVQENTNPDEAKLSKDGSGRGRAFQRPHREKKEGEEEEEAISGEPGKGSRIDCVR